MYQDNRTARPMIQGNWVCSGCGAAITELPFEPDGNRPIYCRDCHKQRAPMNRNDNNRGPRRSY